MSKKEIPTSLPEPRLRRAYREEVSLVKEDRILHYDIIKTVDFLNSFQIEQELF